MLFFFRPTPHSLSNLLYDMWRENLLKIGSYMFLKTSGDKYKNIFKIVPPKVKLDHIKRFIILKMTLWSKMQVGIKKKYSFVQGLCRSKNWTQSFSWFNRYKTKSLSAMAEDENWFYQSKFSFAKDSVCIVWFLLTLQLKVNVIYLVRIVAKDVFFRFISCNCLLFKFYFLLLCEQVGTLLVIGLFFRNYILYSRKVVLKYWILFAMCHEWPNVLLVTSDNILPGRR